MAYRRQSPIGSATRCKRNAHALLLLLLLLLRDTSRN
jgi:hypothetical protein